MRKENSVIGTYEGEVLNPNITNKNGLDITMEVMENVLASEDFKDGIEHGWFIGFLGHPEDPNCMDFQNGCIVMKDMWIENDKIYGKFDLVDTPVGRTVKALQDAGVTFGISIRGAGDIIGNAVDPETFVFRGFDLVSFPAYPDSIPQFTAIAASTRGEDQKKYQAVCAAVKENLHSINSSRALEVLQSQFAPQSEEYAALGQRRAELESQKTLNNIDRQKAEAMTNLYLEASTELCRVSEQLKACQQEKSSAESACRRKVAALRRVTAAQAEDLSRSLDAVTASRRQLTQKVKTLSTDCDRLQRENERLRTRLNDVKASNRSYRQKIAASQEEALRQEHENVCIEDDLRAQLERAQKTNRSYRQKIQLSAAALREKESMISGLQQQLRETVTASQRIETQSSDLDDEIKRIKSELRSCKERLSSYQEAYATMYACALGVNPQSVPYTDATSVEELQKSLESATNTVNLPATVTVDPLFAEASDDDIITL